MPDILARLVIYGIPAVLKNSKQILRNRKTGKLFIASSDAAGKYRKTCKDQLWLQWRGKKPICVPVNLKAVFYGPWKSGDGNVPDESNLLQMPEDVMQEAGIIADDNLVESHDGSRRVYMCDGPCPQRPRYKAGESAGQMRDVKCGMVKACPYARVEIEISAVGVEVPCGEESYRGWGIGK